MRKEITPERWQRVSAFLDQALDLEHDQRAEYLRRLRSQDAEAGDLLGDLLKAAGTDGILDRPAVESAAEALVRIAAGGDEDDATGEPAGGRQAGPWRLLREIGRGGMGVVYLSERADGQFRQTAALKLLKPGLDTDEIQSRFLRERQILARLQHPNIARLLDGGVTEDGRPYFAMEYVAGRPITEVCDGKHATVDERLRLFRDACHAVQYAHGSLVVHRDLKPSNILVAEDGPVKLLDFGIARLLAEEPGGAGAAITRTGLQVMTPQYAAPEQIKGEPATTATDVYGLGLVLYELLAGRRPFVVRGSALPDLERAILDTAPALPSKAVDRPVAAARRTSPERLRRRLRGDLDAIVMTTLRKDPERRYPTAAALGEDLDRLLLGLPVRARRDTAPYRMRKFAGRHRAGVAAAALVTVSLLAGLTGTLWQARAARMEARRAQEVKDFLVGIFQVSDPSQARGEQVTARELLDRGAARVGAELRDQPVLQAEMTGVLADVYEKLGMYDRAAPLAQQSLDLLMSRRDATDLEVSEALRRRGVILIDQGQYDEAVSVLRQAIEKRGQRGRGDDGGRAEALENLASALRSKGDLDEAETLVRQALDIRRRLYGGDRPEIATSLNNLALMLRDRGRLDEAEPLYREAIAIRRRTLGADHPDVAGTLNNLAALLRARGRLEEAEQASREAVAINRGLYGDDNPNTIQSLNSLGAIVQSLGRYDEAETIDRQVVDYWRRSQGEEHPNAVVSLNNLATVLKEKGDYQAAEPLFRQVTEQFPKIVGEKHPFTAISLTHLGATLRETGRDDEAEAVLRRALGIMTALRGEEHPETVPMLTQLGALEQQRGRLDEADRLLDRALAIREKALGPENPATAASRISLGALRREQGRLDQAEEMERAAIDAFRKSYPAGHPEIALALIELGRTETARGRPAEAVTLLREAEAIRGERFGGSSWKTAEARLFLAEALAARGEAAEARALLRAAAPILREQRGGSHPTTRRAESSLRRQGG